MTTATKSAATKSKVKPDSPPKAPDAIAILTADHQGVSDLFDEYEKAKSKTKKKQIVAQICAELTVHAQIEEEIFYPAVKLALKDKELVPEVAVEHASIKSMIAQVEGVDPDGEEYEARITVARVSEASRQGRGERDVPKGEIQRRGFSGSRSQARPTQGGASRYSCLGP
jgi:hemerythrin superfamily protein